MSVLCGERVVVRPFRAEEIEGVLALDIRAAVPRYVTEAAKEARRERLRLSGTRTRWEILFAIEQGGRIVGEIQARYSDEVLPPGVYEIGIEIFEPGDRGKGYGREAVGLLVDHLFEQEGALRVQASTEIDNAAMRSVLERTGFAREGILRGFMPSPDGARDYALYAMTKDDWKDQTGTWI